MIIKFKTYESRNRLPRLGDWVVCEFHEPDCNVFYIYIKNKIGKIVNVAERETYRVFYENLPDSLEQGFVNPSIWLLEEIKFFSEDKKECEIYLESKKFNL